MTIKRFGDPAQRHAAARIKEDGQGHLAGRQIGVDLFPADDDDEIVDVVDEPELERQADAAPIDPWDEARRPYSQPYFGGVADSQIIEKFGWPDERTKPASAASTASDADEILEFLQHDAGDGKAWARIKGSRRT